MPDFIKDHLEGLAIIISILAALVGMWAAVTANDAKVSREEIREIYLVRGKTEASFKKLQSDIASVSERVERERQRRDNELGIREKRVSSELAKIDKRMDRVAELLIQLLNLYEQKNKTQAHSKP